MLRALFYLLILVALAAVALFGYSYTLDPAVEPTTETITIEAG
ncbi:hypothetical protein [Jannaschia sp. Os4]|nr:hypothetical protein [Jannaschia sp. Os4]